MLVGIEDTTPLSTVSLEAKATSLWVNITSKLLSVPELRVGLSIVIVVPTILDTLVLVSNIPPSTVVTISLTNKSVESLTVNDVVVAFKDATVLLTPVFNSSTHNS